MKFSMVWLVAALGLLALGCESGGVGDPCTPEDEYTQGFANFSDEEVNVESRSFQCETRICLVNHFQGRVSCPYGQSETDVMSLAPNDPARCRIPGTDGNVDPPPAPQPPAGENYEEITTPVLPQLVDRQADKAVYCSCRCDGPDEGARYCECPSGYKCTELVKELGLQGGQLAGSYCVRNGTEYDPTNPPTGNCDRAAANCGNDGNNPN
jgi:hypothetical protein